MENRFASARGAIRVAPRHSATAAVYAGENQLAYGVLTNVSEAGACIVTDSRLMPGEEVSLKLSFYQQPGLIETSARVVWNRIGSGIGPGHRCGHAECFIEKSHRFSRDRRW